MDSVKWECEEVFDTNKMRDRYFSPEVNFTSAQVLPASPVSPKQNRLRWAGSMNKLLSSSNIAEDTVKKIGNYVYDVSQKIGEGYSSKVYKAINSRDNKEYAVKVIELKRYSTSSLQMLESQISILRRLDHPNIIKCYDVFKNSSHCHIITEYCPQGDLLTYINKSNKNGKIMEQKAIEIVAQIAQGLKYLMRCGILHRDLKPANILSNRKEWKIADFGFAIYSFTEIKTKHNVGTPLYMPIEALCNNVYSPQSDIFSVGVIFYELLTGTTPWECKSEKELIKKMGVLPFSIEDKYKVSKQVVTVLERLCAVDIIKRVTKEDFLEWNPLKTPMSIALLALNPQDPNKKIGKKRSGSLKFPQLIGFKAADQKETAQQNPSFEHSMKVNEMQQSPTKGKLETSARTEQMERLNFHNELSISISEHPRQLNDSQKADKKREKKESSRERKEGKVGKVPAHLAIDYSCASIRTDQLDSPLNMFKSAVMSPKEKLFSSTSQELKKNLSNTTADMITSDGFIRNMKSPIRQANRSELEQESANVNEAMVKQEKNGQKILETPKETRLEIKNNHILINQLHYCRFLHYMIKNIECFLLSPRNKLKLCLILSEHLKKLMWNLSDERNNWFQLKSWAVFKDSKKYYLTSFTIKEYLIRYQKNYLNLLKQSEPSLIKELKKELEDLVDIEQFTVPFYNTLQEHIIGMIREFNHSLNMVVSSPKKEISQTVKSNIQAIKSLYKYYKLIESSSLNFEDFELFQRKSNIRIEMDYQKSTNVTIDQFLELRQTLKAI